MSGANGKGAIDKHKSINENVLLYDILLYHANRSDDKEKLITWENYLWNVDWCICLCKCVSYEKKALKLKANSKIAIQIVVFIIR